MKKLTTVATVILCVFINYTYAQFEGVVSFNRIKEETTSYSLTVKGSKIRIEEYAVDGKIKGIELIDNDKKEVLALSPERKIYMEVVSKEGSKISPKVDKTNNKKTIQGYECTEWIVELPLEDTRISYWVTKKEDGFHFFDDMLLTLNRKDKMAKYFMAIPDNNDVFPLEATEQTMSGSVKMKIEVRKIEKKKVDVNSFVIPSDFQKFEK
jgi:hypothetical protein